MLLTKRRSSGVAVQNPQSTSSRVLDWSELNAVMSGDETARYRVYVVEVVKYLGLYRPLSPEFPAVLDGVQLESIKAASRTETPTDEGKLHLAAFGQWRTDVLRAEVTMEKRLRALAGALEQIRKAPPATNWAEAQQNKNIIERHLRQVWKLEPPAVGQDIRAWAQTHARRPDLLPKSWREL